MALNGYVLVRIASERACFSTGLCGAGSATPAANERSTPSVLSCLYGADENGQNCHNPYRCPANSTSVTLGDLPEGVSNAKHSIQRQLPILLHELNVASWLTTYWFACARIGFQPNPDGQTNQFSWAEGNDLKLFGCKGYCNGENCVNKTSGLPHAPNPGETQTIQSTETKRLHGCARA